MSDTDRREKDQRAAVDQIRKTMAEGFAFVRGAEITRSVSSMTFEELLSRQVLEISEDKSDIRPSKLNKIRNLKEAVIAAVDRAIELPAHVFDLEPSEGQANTEEEES